jgi:hypothetical protein
MFVDEPSSGSVDLSKATKLSDAVFWCGKNPRWIATTLRTITPNHRGLQQISLNKYATLFTPDRGHVDLVSFRRRIGEAGYAGWSELDHILVQLWESQLVTFDPSEGHT